MSSVKQYTQLYSQNREIIDQRSAPALNALRQQAFDALTAMELPKLGQENYEITDLNQMYTADYGININRIPMAVDPSDAFRCDVPNLTTWLYFLCNDVFNKSKTANINLPEGVIIDSLRSAAINHTELVEKYYGQLANSQNAEVALNTLLAQDGIFVYIPDGVELAKPIQLVNILNADAPIMAVRRILIVAGENAHAKILACDHTQNKDVEFLNSQVVEIFASKNSQIDFYDMEESSINTNRNSSLFALQQEGSNLLIDAITLSNGRTRNNFQINIDGEHCQTTLLGMAIGSDSQHIDNHTLINHHKGYCQSNELFKYLLDDQSRGAFTGKIYVDKNAPKIEAYQSNRNICAGEKARMHTKPQLEIYTDDVKCSHGATVGQLDAEAQFYMQTRGISVAEARILLMQAFMSDIIEGVRLPSLQDRLRHLVDKRLQGNPARCANCGNTCQEKIG